MKQEIPDYAASFRCLAGNCRHTCCAGWEIDIDSASLERYRAVPGDFGNRLRCAIREEGDCASFLLTGDDERCPFLREDGLCEIILTLGEDALCQICTDHPRFRNFFSDRVETCPGLCCEEAARLLLTSPSPITLTKTDDGMPSAPPTPWESRLRAVRDTLFSAAQDRTLSLRTRCAELLAAADVPLTVEELTGEAPLRAFLTMLGELEQMDPAWNVLLAHAARTSYRDPFADDLFPEYGEKLLWYFLFRHVSSAEDAVGLSLRTAMAVLLSGMILFLFHTEQISCTEEAADIARLASSEIEYSEENTDAVLADLFSRFP